jgi:signal peptidase I
MPDPPPRRPSAARTLAEIPILLVIAALIAFGVKSLLAQAFYIPSESMVPQLQVNDRVVVSKLAYKTHEPRRGDIIVFDDPNPARGGVIETERRTGLNRLLNSIGEAVGLVQPSTDEFIKRVIALPGETVEGRDGHVYINGKQLFEPYLEPSVSTSDFLPVKVEPGRLWVMGDNRNGSADSRVFGTVLKSTIVGRAVLKVWPPSSISFL